MFGKSRSASSALSTCPEAPAPGHARHAWTGRRRACMRANFCAIRRCVAWCACTPRARRRAHIRGFGACAWGPRAASVAAPAIIKATLLFSTRSLVSAFKPRSQIAVKFHPPLGYAEAAPSPRRRPLYLSPSWQLKARSWLSDDESSPVTLTGSKHVECLRLMFLFSLLAPHLSCAGHTQALHGTPILHTVMSCAR